MNVVGLKMKLDRPIDRDRNDQEWVAQNCAPPPNDDLDVPHCLRRDRPPKEVEDEGRT